MTQNKETKEYENCANLHNDYSLRRLEIFTGIIGCKNEQRDFLEWMASEETELICVYGRRRVGKTYFVYELLNGYHAFDASAQGKSSEIVRLRIFHAALREYGDVSSSAPSDWWEAFDRLKTLLDRHECPLTPEGMRAVFIDELPWFDVPRSEFMTVFSDFRNRWCVRRKDVKLIICGSATSWILREVLQREGSLNRRVTHSLCLQPFSLRECEEFLRNDKGSSGRDSRSSRRTWSLAERPIISGFFRQG